MRVVAAAGYHHFTLTHELDLSQLIWRAFIKDVKCMVPSENRSYDSTTNEWTIADAWWPTIQELHDKHFSDPNQLSLLEDE